MAHSFAVSRQTMTNAEIAKIAEVLLFCDLRDLCVKHVSAFSSLAAR
jgi:hypothetical protein